MRRVVEADQTIEGLSNHADVHWLSADAEPINACVCDKYLDKCLRVTSACTHVGWEASVQSTLYK